MASHEQSPYRSRDVASPDYGRNYSEATRPEICIRVEKIGMAYAAFILLVLSYNFVANLRQPHGELATEPYQPIVAAVPTEKTVSPKIVEIQNPKIYEYHFEITFSDPLFHNGEPTPLQFTIRSKKPLSQEETEKIIQRKIQERINPPMA